MDAFSTTNERLWKSCDVDNTHLFLSMTLYKTVASEPASDGARELSASFIWFVQELSCDPWKSSSKFILPNIDWLSRSACTELRSDLSSALCAYRGHISSLRGLYD